MKQKTYNKSIRNTIFIYFTITSLIAVLLIVISIYSRISAQLSDTTKEENVNRINRICWSAEVYIRNMIKLSDTIYYRIIKNTDLSKKSVSNKFSLLYNNNQGQIKNIVLLSKKGDVLSAFPAVRLRENANIENEDWFKKTLNKPENIHFTSPHVQRMFQSDDNGWVISLSRAVEVTIADSTEQAVLLIEMSYQGLNEVLKGIYTDLNYVYLITADGDIIWHPKFNLITAGGIKEDNLILSGYADGSYDKEFSGNQTVAVKTVGYTGWKLIGIIKGSGISLNMIKTRFFIAFVIFLIIFIVAIINAYISFRLTNPIRELEKSVKKLEGNLDADIYMGGSYEIQHLSNSVQDMRNKIKRLMEDIVREHEEKRKSELNSLQAQINPHFLYNTLDIIVWQIENGKQSDAVHIVTALARFFRLSLAKGENIVTVGAEIEHVKNYLAIQHTRFKNKFDYEFAVEDRVLGLSSLKLTLQPLVENAVYHGCEFMDGDGLIIIEAWEEGDALYISVSDNGLGMTEEKVEMVLSGNASSGKGNGSGIGVKNVNERIKLYFGEEYGLKIKSEPDEGTVITIHLPVIPYKGERHE